MPAPGCSLQRRLHAASGWVCRHRQVLISATVVRLYLMHAEVPASLDAASKGSDIWHTFYGNYVSFAPQAQPADVIAVF